MWTLLIFALGGPSITVDGFSNPVDCRALGRSNVEYVQYGIKGVQYACAKTGRPAIACERETRVYARRTDECLSKRD